VNLTIDFNNDQDLYEIRPAMRAIIRKAVFNTLIYEGFDKDVEVSVTFTDNEKIKELNATYRNKNSATDVLSFPMYDDFSEMSLKVGTIPLGDIVISVQTAKKQAYDFYHSIYHELAFLSIHSTLHLLGYDHETSKEDEEEMFGKQKEIMEIIGF
jgi:probable rRNA maturation factor